MKKVTVYGTGCKKCRQLHENALAAQLPDAEVDYVTDMAQIAAAGVMSMPALAVDGEVVSSGRVLSPDEIRSAAGA